MKTIEEFKQPIKTLKFSDLKEKKPEYYLAGNVDLVVIRYGENASVLYGRCLHRGALLSDGFIDGDNLICGVHFWDYRYDTGVSEYNNEEKLHKFSAAIKDDYVYIDGEEIKEFQKENPQQFKRDEYLGTYADTAPESAEPFTMLIQDLAKNGLKNHGKHGPLAAMGVHRDSLPKWENIQFLPAQLSKRPLEDGDKVNSQTVIGPRAKKPLTLEMPIFVSDMSFGALSKETKIALAKGAESAGTGIASGEGGMLEKEQAENSRYFYEYASAKFGFSWEKVKKVQALHFKAGQGAKTGTGGHLPGDKVTKELAEVRGGKAGEDSISPAAFDDLKTPKDFAEFADEVRKMTGGIPVGFKMAASRIEEDIDFALEAGADYIILDGRGGGTGAAPAILRDNINVPTIPALARARKRLDKSGAKDVSLIITGGLRVPEDFAKALMMGADAVAIANAAIQAVGCLGMRACNTDNCPVGVATQNEKLRARLNVDKSAEQLKNFLLASKQLIEVIARACGYDDVAKFNLDDLTTFDYDMHRLTGVRYGGV